MEKTNFLSNLKSLLLFIAVLWVILVISFFVPPIKGLGILPRKLFGLIGIVTSPFLHADSVHLVTNSVSLLILGSIFIGLEKGRTLVISLNIIIFGGLGTWLIGRSNSNHIGASGLVYGIMGYLFATGIFNRDFKTLMVSILVFLLYGGAVWGALPGNTFISWESHLCGFIAGVVMAKAFSKR